MSDSIHTPENPDEQKDARTVGMDEVVIYDAVQRLVRRVDKQAAEIEALRDELARVRVVRPDVRFCPECGYAVGNCPTACSHYEEARTPQGHSRWCMSVPTVGVPIGPCDCMTGAAQEATGIQAMLQAGRWDAEELGGRWRNPRAWDAADAALDSLLARLEAVTRERDEVVAIQRKYIRTDRT